MHKNEFKAFSIVIFILNNLKSLLKGGIKLNIKLVYSFLALCKYEKFSSASDFLNISQQGLSRQIKILESELNVTLFTRSHYGVKLTDCGEQLKHEFLNMAESYENMLKIIEQKSLIPQDKLNVGVGFGITSAISLNFVTDFNKLFPEITINLIELYYKDCLPKLNSGEIDFAFVPIYSDKSNLDVTHISTDSLYAYISIK